MRASIFSHFDKFLVENLSLGKLLMIGLPALLGVGIGFLISRGQWMYALILVVLIPIAILFAKRPFIGVFIYLILMPLSSAFPNADTMYLLIHRGLILLTLLVVVFLRLFNRKNYQPIRLGFPEIALAFLVAYVPISLLYSQVDMQAPLRDFVDRMLIPLCIYLIVRITPLDKKNIEFMQWAAFFIAISQCAIVFLGLMAPQILPFAWRSYYTGRAAGSLSNPYVMADVLIFCIGFLLFAAMNRKSDLIRILFLSICALSTVCIFLSMERAVWLAGIVVIIGLIFLYPRTFLRLSLIIGIVIIILWGGVLAPRFSAAVQRIGQVQQVYARVVATDAMLQMIQIKPVFGWGYDTLNNNISQFYRTVGEATVTTSFVTSHNTYLTILTELGLVGLLFYLVPIVWWFMGSIQVRKQFARDGSWNRSLLLILWLVILNFFILSNSADMKWFPFDQVLFWMMLGLVASIVNPLKQRMQLRYGQVDK
jgi:O-antigen ligase